MSQFRSAIIVLSLMLLIVIGACSHTDDSSKVNETDDIIELDDEDLTKSESAEADDKEEKVDTEETVADTDNDEKIEVAENKVSEDTSSKTTEEPTNTSKNQGSDKKQPTAPKKTETKKSETKKTETKKPATPKKETKPAEDKKPSVTLSITVPTGVTGPSYGPKEMELNSGDTVYDVLLKSGLSVNAIGNGASTYVRGIDGLNEFDEGALSGWNYKVDGVMAGNSAGKHQAVDGQKIKWIYTTDFTE